MEQPLALVQVGEAIISLYWTLARLLLEFMYPVLDFPVQPNWSESSEGYRVG